MYAAVISRSKKAGIVFLLVGLGCILFSTYVRTHNADIYPIQSEDIHINPQLYSESLSANTPLRIRIPNVHIDLPVVNAPVMNGYWQLSDTSASYGMGSGHPGSASNTVIFAHARQGLFYTLQYVHPGDIVYVKTEHNTYTYTVSGVRSVYPNQTAVIQPTKKETLTLYTCTGFYDEKRLIVTALPQNTVTAAELLTQ